MKRNILSIFSLVGVGLLFYILFFQKSNQQQPLFVLILVIFLVVATFLNTGKKK
jgi:uncharacterized membrane protein